ncbi:MAG: Lrp/AsnC family transcriptional regulator [Candidatus Thermoplasmatota archaeon]|jgi:DNA-binding Lrp family transcriptional regulator|nr:MAG: transcription regulator [Thermoplasmatales archaeon Gpl]MCI2412016.1 Lrp/AsnC family transcriptional regulator [Cuniculiplasma sp.]MCL4320072.1 Lrp/AsnC family transcriptional regulator [Candidatus Thermoplasmatota archaeon]MCL6015409.1 Lrp/AsnC family transcriptional regulator [Candidatus Thermoplasmatota archaeon]WMT49544.1 MAG: Lrp/AsnC family transcriptional regulator [Thermoplasmatales archaeon]
MDDKDSRILEYLMEKGRDKIADISRNLDIPRITIYERMQNMISNGVIKGFTAIPDYSQLGLGAMAYVFVSFDPKANVKQREMARIIGNFPQVYEVSIVAGQWDLIIKVRGKSIEEIGEFVLDKLRSVAGVERTETITVFSSIK